MSNLELVKSTPPIMQERNQRHLQVPSHGMPCQIQEQVPYQGWTISPDRLLEGTTIFTDAAWRCRTIPGAEGQEATGIGIHIQHNSATAKWSIRIQAAAPQESSVFQAEAKGLLLAAKLMHVFSINRPKLVTDNQLLAKVAAGRKLDHPLLHWNAREYLADYFEATSSSSPQVFHISRKFNEAAHNYCAAQALRQSLDQPSFRCSSSAHSRHECPVISIMQHVLLQDFVILAT